ncbi:RNA polymerase sigma factor [Fervidobacterium thailandense]|uniref:RNA polymerase sigma factor n=1 Tax=Fervidobacterium thailandense TaxID=1008305 RepID=A0A1E3G0W6_9BACT|nr:sigma-70 family RNA polymerase sigma factor [Fervidobacterium thailandense]ODN29862.1 RNA polymerase subunit sigma-70 [Fervidobacterium thailandense]
MPVSKEDKSREERHDKIDSKDERNYLSGGQINWKNEHALIAALKRGDEQAFRYLYRVYGPKIGALAKGYLGVDDVDDIVQDVILKVFKGVKKFREDAKLSTWIYKITINVCNNVYKKFKHRETLLELNDSYAENGHQSQYSTNEDLQKAVLDEVLYEKLRDAIEKLSPEDRAILYMKEIENLTYEEISEILGKPVGTIKSRLHYVKERLKKELEEEYENE